MASCGVGHFKSHWHSCLRPSQPITGLYYTTIMSNLNQESLQKTPNSSHGGNLLAGFHDTPQSCGSRTNVSYREKTKNTDYHPFLVEDLQSRNDVSSDLFIELILGTPNQVKPLSRYRQDRYDAALKNYQNATTENNRYAPFCELVNEILLNADEHDSAKKALSGGQVDVMQFCRNDPQFAQGSHAMHKPDNVMVATIAYTQNGRDSVDNMMKNGPKDKPFQWAELAVFLEMKATVGRIIKGPGPLVLIKSGVVCQSSTFHCDSFFF